MLTKKKTIVAAEKKPEAPTFQKPMMTKTIAQPAVNKKQPFPKAEVPAPQQKVSFEPK